MRAAVLRNEGDVNLDVTDSIDVIDPGPDDVGVKITHTGVCHSDVSAMDGTIPQPAPAVLGHEGAGTILGVGDPEFVTSYEDLLAQAIEMSTYAQALGEERRDNPADDITSVLMAAEVDGEQLTAQEFGSFFILLVVAGNETTRNALSHGIKALTDFPDQKELLYNDFDAHSKTAMEEIVRWGTPVIHFRRTATEDTELSGTPIKEGEKVVMFYNSANRDERVFDDPFKFDVARPLQPAQVGFGAGGPHFCLGANLARREMTVMFDEIQRRLPSLRVVGEPDYLQSNFINGIKRMQCAWD